MSNRVKRNGEKRIKDLFIYITSSLLIMFREQFKICLVMIAGQIS